MTVTLKNQHLTVTIDDMGAELCSVVDAAGSEYIWQADPDVWGRHAPLLFPVIGRLLDGVYTLNDQTYTISNHGFARDSRFALTQQTDTRAVFTLTDTPNTQKVYPYSFILTVTYELTDNKLKKSCKVENRTGQTMYYELGGHDGFCIPRGESMDDYAVVVPGLEDVVSYGLNEQFLVTPKTVVLPVSHGRISLKPLPTYGLDTVILDSPEEHTALLVNKAGQPRVTLEFPGYDYLGIWTADKAADTNYICIEPWTTLPDASFVGRGLADKAGIRTLAPGGEETLCHTITFH